MHTREQWSVIFFPQGPVWTLALFTPAIFPIRPAACMTPMFPLYYNICKLIAQLPVPQVIPTLPTQGLFNPSRPCDSSIPPQASTQPEPIHSNTNIHYPLFTPHQLPMPLGQWKPKGWERLAARYPLEKVIATICGICKFGARISYESIREKPTIHPNLSTADTDTHLVTSDIAAETSMNRFLVYPNEESLPAHFTASPPGLVDKADGSKRRTHHLSYPAIGSDSINAGIPEHYGTISYSGIHDAILAVQDMGRNCILVKRDFESAFRHIPVSPLDSALLGFKWQGIHYSECFLPFGLRTAHIYLTWSP